MTDTTNVAWTIVVRIEDTDRWIDWSTGHRSVPDVLAAAELIVPVSTIAEIRFDRITTVRERFSLADLGAGLHEQPADRAELRDRIAALFRCPPGAERLGDATPGEIADAVSDDLLAARLAPLEAQARAGREQQRAQHRAQVLREAADRLDTRAASVGDVSDDPAIFVAKARIHDAGVWREATTELRLMAACQECEWGVEHTEHCPYPESHNWGCGCPSDQSASGPVRVAGETQQPTDADVVEAHELALSFALNDADTQQPLVSTADKAAALGLTDTEYRARSHAAAVATVRAAIPGMYAHVGFRVEDVLNEAGETQQPETQADDDAARLAKVTRWVTSEVVTAKTEFGDGYRAAQRDIRDLVKGRFDYDPRLAAVSQPETEA